MNASFAALALVGALLGFLGGLYLFGIAPELWLPAGMLAVAGCWAAVRIIARADKEPGEDEKQGRRLRA